MQKQPPPPDGPAGVVAKIGGSENLFASGAVKHLTAFIVATGWAGDVARNCGAALRAGFEDWGTPAVRSLTEALTALGLSAFWIGHVLKGVAISIDRGHSKLRLVLRAFLESGMIQ